MTMYGRSEGDGIDYNPPIGQLASSSVVPWWTSVGSLSVNGDQFGSGQWKSLSVELPAGIIITSSGCGAGTTNKRSEQLQDVELGLGNGNPTQFTISCGEEKKAVPAQPNISAQSDLPEYHTLELGYGLPMLYTKYPLVGQGCNLLPSACGPPIKGRIMLPFSLTTDEGPIYVNAKQYHGIMRRRQSRAKAEFKNRAIKARKPYMHESRHRHAMRRARGAGGRFLNTKNMNVEKNEGAMKKHKHARVQFAQPTGSQNSEVVQSGSGNLNSNGDGNSKLSGSLEVTSMYSPGEFDLFQFSNPRSACVCCSLSNCVGSGHGIVMPNKWGAVAGNNCCHLKV